MDKKLKDILNDITEEIKLKNFYVNSGGCGWFAYLLSKKLFELRLYYSIVVIDCPAGSRRLINTLRKESHKIPSKDWLSARHYMVQIEDYYIDGTYIGKTIPETHQGYSKSSSFLYPENIKIACLEGDWNDYFDCSNIPEIKNIIEKHFKNY